MIGRERDVDTVDDRQRETKIDDRQRERDEDR